MAKWVSVSTEPVTTLEQLVEYDRLLFGNADLMHCDVMDGVFVEQKLLPFEVLSAYAQKASLPLDIHLMTMDLYDDYQKYLSLKPKFLTVHYETFTNEERLKKVLMLIRAQGVGAGLCINPQTSLEQVKQFLPLCNLLLIMSVKAGFGGQTFLPQTVQKVAEAKKMINKKRLSTLIEVDGGITPLLAKTLFDKGADIIVSGSYVFRAESHLQAIWQLKA